MNNEPMDKEPMRIRPGLVSLLLFVVALIPRLPGLARFLTSDENTNIFFAGSDVVAAFLRGDFRGTYWHFYPGVTMSWLDGLGLAGQYWLDLLNGKPVPPFTDYIYGDILSLLVANRLPYAILTAAAVPVFYLLARKLLPQPMALFGALLLAVNPFFLAHSRVAHGDAPVAVFMGLSALTFFVYVDRINESASRRVSETTNQETTRRSLIRFLTEPYLIASAVFGSLAALTKTPGPFMLLFVVGVSAVYAILEIWPLKKMLRPAPSAWRILLSWLAVIAVWGVVALVVFILLWPSMWVDPIGTVRQMLAETFGKVNEGHLVYFFGQPTLDPGFWFYFYVIPFRLTPIVLIGSLLSLLIFVPSINSYLNLSNSTRRALVLLWFFAITLLLFGNLSPKKQDRYLLPLFPFFDLLAAMGWVGLVEFGYHVLKSQISGRKSMGGVFPISKFLVPKLSLGTKNFMLLILLLLHLLPVFTYYPYYLTYFNPLMGGPTRAAETTLMGWGEGMEQVAAYLNTRPNAESLYVASTPSQTLLPYFVGTGENFYTNDIALRADYVVLYLAQMQRRAPSPEIVAYFEAQEPEKTITIKGVTYAKIFPGPKFILSDIPPQATPINIGLDNTIRLAGYTVANSESTLKLTLYWHALAPLSADYTISVRVRAANGSLLAQQDTGPVGGLLPTSQWRQGDYVIDVHTLDLAGIEAKQIADVQIVVYNLETGTTLGPPIVLPMNNGSMSQ
ncbi:MAG: glycosyltransferase family 39 protein [Anaerolineae bacterium]|nr:glycosyltransferase family 39 protein [Anaerolineae bacterium]